MGSAILSMKAVTVGILTMLAIGNTSADSVAADDSCPREVHGSSLLQTKTIVAQQGQSCTWSVGSYGVPQGKWLSAPYQGSHNKYRAVPVIREPDGTYKRT